MKAIPVKQSDPNRCGGHVWRHLCETTKIGKPTGKLCNKGGIVDGCDRLMCVNCGGQDRYRQSYVCNKCKKSFWVFTNTDKSLSLCYKCDSK